MYIARVNTLIGFMSVTVLIVMLQLFYSITSLPNTDLCLYLHTMRERREKMPSELWSSQINVLPNGTGSQALSPFVVIMSFAFYSIFKAFPATLRIGRVKHQVPTFFDLWRQMRNLWAPTVLCESFKEFIFILFWSSN